MINNKFLIFGCQEIEANLAFSHTKTLFLSLTHSPIQIYTHTYTHTHAPKQIYYTQYKHTHTLSLSLTHKQKTDSLSKSE
jgi:hypothetical protein